MAQQTWTCLYFETFLIRRHLLQLMTYYFLLFSGRWHVMYGNAASGVRWVPLYGRALVINEQGTVWDQSWRYWTQDLLSRNHQYSKDSEAWVVGFMLYRLAGTRIPPGFLHFVSVQNNNTTNKTVIYFNMLM